MCAPRSTSLRTRTLLQPLSPSVRPQSKPRMPACSRQIGLACILKGTVSAGLLFKPHGGASPAPPATGSTSSSTCALNSDAADRTAATAKSIVQSATDDFRSGDDVRSGDEDSFAEDSFAELVFLSVEESRQVQGLGSRLMNRLKAEALRQVGHLEAGLGSGAKAEALRQVGHLEQAGLGSEAEAEAIRYVGVDVGPLKGIAPASLAH